ncbi:MAG: hypothetical protein ACR2HQ_12335 [Ilumatobacteraceae bacterium]
MADDDDINDGPQEPVVDELEVDELDDVDEDVEPDADELEDTLVEEDVEVDDDEVVAEDAADEDESAEATAARNKRRAGEEEDDDDEEVPSPDDVEADLDRILKDRLVTTEDEDDEDEEPDDRAETGDRLQPKRADEQLCPNCFLLVRATAPGCPVGDDNCPVFG